MDRCVIVNIKRTYIYIYMYVQRCVRMCVYIYIYVCVCVHICIQVSPCVYTCIHVYPHEKFSTHQARLTTRERGTCQEGDADCAESCGAATCCQGLLCRIPSMQV